MAKPFNIQSPEDIAKTYGGNKQQIAQAMQMGIVDPTAGVLAGMFIDRMRSAQMQEMAPQTTVAQQVMGGAPAVGAAVPPAPAQAAGGLGLTPQGAPPMAPQAPTEEPPMGMAEGGIAGLDIPDTMFDEPSNGGFDDGYAGGGIVAFADGGGIDPATLRRALRAQESSGDYGVTNTQGSGAMGAYQFMPATARALAKRIGVPYRPDLMSGNGGRSAEGRAYQEHLMDAQMQDILRFSGGNLDKAAAYHFAGPNTAGWGKDTRQYISDIKARMGGAGTSGTAPTVGGLGATPPAGNLADAFPGALKAGEEYYAANMPERSNESLNLLSAQARETLDPENQKKQADQDKWMTLAEIGFNMASSNSPYLLQAAGAAAAAALPGARAAKREREAAKREAIRDLAAVEDITYKQAAEKTKFITDFASTQLGLKKDDLARATNIWERQYSEAAQTGRTEAQIQGQKDISSMENEARKDIAEIGSTSRDTTFDIAYKNNYDMLKAQAEAGTWKTPMGNKPSDAVIRYHAHQKALEDINKYKAAGSSSITDANNDGIPDTFQSTGAGVGGGVPGGAGGQQGVVTVPWK